MKKTPVTSTKRYPASILDWRPKGHEAVVLRCAKELHMSLRPGGPFGGRWSQLTADEQHVYIEQARAALKPLKRRKSCLYHIDTYSGGWFIRAFDIAEARRKVLKALFDHRFSGGYTVKRATKAQIKWGYPYLT